MVNFSQASEKPTRIAEPSLSNLVGCTNMVNHHICFLFREMVDLRQIVLQRAIWQPARCSYPGQPRTWLYGDLSGPSARPPGTRRGGGAKFVSWMPIHLRPRYCVRLA